MVESNASTPLEQKLSPIQSKDAYEVHREKIFDALEHEKSPLLVDTEATELMFLVLRNSEFTQLERLKEFVFISQLAMSRMCRYIGQQQTSDQTIEKQAEMIHNTYAQVFAHSMVELTKLVDPRPPLEQ